MKAEKTFLPIKIKLETAAELELVQNMCTLFDKSMKDTEYTKEQLDAYKTFVGIMAEYFNQ